MGKFEQPRSNREETELEEAFRAATGSSKSTKKPQNSTAAKAAAGKTSSRSNGTIAAICITAAVLLVAIIAGSMFFFLSPRDDGLILPNVMVAGINVGGMSPEEASNVIHLSTDKTYPQKDMIISLPAEEIHLTPADTKVSLDVEAAVEAAYAYGRTGTKAEQREIRKSAENTTHTLDLIPYLTLDNSYVQSVVQALGEKYNSTLTQPTVTITGERPVLEPGKVDENAPHQVITLTLGRPESALDTTSLYSKIIDAYSSNVFSVQLDFEVLQPTQPDLEAIFQEYCVSPTDAVLDTNTYQITPEIYGYGFDIQAAQALLAQAGPGPAVELTLDYLTPEVTAESINATLFQDVLGSCEAYQASNSNRANNLNLACKAINGMILKPGETFSFNNALGERTEAKGYKGAPAYVGGQSVTSIGGGICQVSSSLYYSALLADLEIVERECHIYPSDYVPMGMDATVNWGTLDFKFRNNTNYPIRIEAYASNSGQVNITLYGTDERDYYVKMSYEVVETYSASTVYREMEKDNPDGYRDGDVIQSAHTGYKVNTYKSKYSKADNSLISKEFETVSRYSKRDEIICKIITPEPTIPAPTETEPTEPEPITPDDPTIPIEPEADTPSDPGFSGVAGDGGEG